jgi:hypothetical protein
MIKESNNMHSKIEELKNISICDLLYMVVFDIIS